MTNPEIIAARSILVDWLGAPASQATLKITKLSGGTEAVGVYRIVASCQDGQGRRRQRRLILKHLTGRSRREATILRDLVARDECGLLPQLLGTFDDGKGNTFLGLEEVRQSVAWPWRDTRAGSSLMRKLGEFHVTPHYDGLVSTDWNYEAELALRAEDTRACLEQCRRNPDLSGLTRSLRFVDRLVRELPRLRQALLREKPFEARLIHGDVHSGNALIRRGSKLQPVLIDWGRARLGSPLEDVSSMLQSLRFYEPAVLQRHDRLLKDYLTGTGSQRHISDSLRGAYWTAGASNALAGALAWHLMLASDEQRPKRQRHTAYCAARDWLRIIRRAHAWAL